MNDLSAVPRSRAAGAALIAGGGVYFVAEFIAAAAWTDPPYSYTYHFVSNLGVRGPSTAFGQFMYSPLAWVMNTGFILFGLAVMIGVLMLRGMPTGRRWALIATAALLAAGSTLVALFPGSSEDSPWHGLGALAAFGSGNVLAILLGRAHRLLGVSRRLGRALVVLGIVGFVSLVLYLTVATGTGVLIGFFERGVIYPFLIGFIILGAAMNRIDGTAIGLIAGSVGRSGASHVNGGPGLQASSRPVRSNRSTSSAQRGRVTAATVGAGGRANIARFARPLRAAVSVRLPREQSGDPVLPAHQHARWAIVCPGRARRTGIAILERTVLEGLTMTGRALMTLRIVLMLRHPRHAMRRLVQRIARDEISRHDFHLSSLERQPKALYHR